MLTRPTLISLVTLSLATGTALAQSPPPGDGATAPGTPPSAPAPSPAPSPSPSPPPAPQPQPAPAPGTSAPAQKPSPPPPASPKAESGTQAQAGASISASPKGTSAGATSRAPVARPVDSGEHERRVVVFTDGPSPRLVSSGKTSVRGPLELEVRFRDVNPLCYAYSTTVAASRVAATDQPLPVRAPGIAGFSAQTAVSFRDVDQAFEAVYAAQNDLDELLHAARFQVSLDDVWAACDGGSSVAAQRGRVEAAAKTLAAKLGEGGSWREILGRAEATSLGAKRLVRGMDTEARGRTDEVEARRAELRAAEQKSAELEQRAERTGRARAMREQLDAAERDIASAQRRLREAELGVARQRHSADLARAAEQLGERVRLAVESLNAMTADVNRARSLLAQSPTAIRRRFAAGESVSIVVHRTRLDRGEVVPGRPPQRFEVPAFRTFRPVIMDVGLGPAMGIGRNRAQYETVLTPVDEERPATWRVVRTEQGLNLDLMVSISAYLWKRRYLDDGVFDAWQLVPRPMVGISLDRPFDVLYAGVQIDPIQYLNIAGGARIANEQQLIGPQPLDPALRDRDGEPQPPVTREEVQVSGFVAITVSTNLVYRWIQQGL
jgi:hypothetical protein